MLAPGEGIVGPNAPGTPTEDQGQKYSLITHTLEWLQGNARLRPDALPGRDAQADRPLRRQHRAGKTSPQMARQEISRIARATDRLPLIDTELRRRPPGMSMATPIAPGGIAEMLEATPASSPTRSKRS